MTFTRALLLPVLFLLISGSQLTACGSRGPTPPDAVSECEAGRIEEGFALIKEIGRVESAADQDPEVVALCLDSAVEVAEDRGAWASLANQLRVVDQLGSMPASATLEDSLTAARAAVAYARISGDLCCLQDGLAEFDALQADAAPAAADPDRAEVDHWYRRALEGRVEAGEWVVEIGGRMVFAPAMVDVVPDLQDEGARARVGQPIVLHNALLMAARKGEPTVSSGDAYPQRIRDAGEGDYRAIVARKPGEGDGTVLAALWDEGWTALLADLHPGVMHTCEGQLVEIEGAEGPVGAVVLHECTPETARTDALFRQRVCTVCGTREEREVCKVGFGRSDTQAAAKAKEEVCGELLGFDEFPASCGSLVQMTRSCSPNHATPDEAPPPATP